jgi:putative flippase GtrA
MSIVVYFFVGGVSFLANFGIFLMFVHLMGLHWVLGNIAGFIAGTFVNYVLSVRFVFKSKNFLRRDFEVYLTFMVSTLGVGLETMLIHLGHDVANLNLNVSKLGAAGGVFFWNYGARQGARLGSHGSHRGV